MLAIERTSGNNFTASDQSTKDILKKGFFGNGEKGKMKLYPEEVLYLIDVRNAECTYKGKSLTFNDIASKSLKTKKFTARYFTYKDWRDRGLIIKRPTFKHGESGKTPIKEYPKSSLALPIFKLKGLFFKQDLITIVEDSENGKKLYESLWFGQYGSYKAADRGKLNKLDAYEALFLLDKGTLHIENATRKALIKSATARRKDFLKLYEVYADWRQRNYVIKTGFKFGTHFRIYFPGAKPVKGENDDWTHSKHVIHVFPKDSKMLIAEWARAIRVAHSVRKTFILAVPGTTTDKKVELDFILYHRKGGDAETPENTTPKYAMLSMSEEEYIGGKEFAGAIKEAKSKHMELILAIADRETAVTYYKVRQIRLPGSENEYFEIDWMQP